MAENCGAACGGSELPVDLVSLEAKVVNRETLINWSTASEKDNSHFLLQHSNDGLQYETIANISGNVNATTFNVYTYRDVVVAGLVYYRLVQVDVDGAEDIYGPITVDVQPMSSTNVYPNPVTDVLNVEFDGPSVDWKLITMTGTVSSGGNNSTGSFQLDLSSLPTGTYQLILLSATGVVTEKVIK